MLSLIRNYLNKKAILAYEAKLAAEPTFYITINDTEFVTNKDGSWFEGTERDANAIMNILQKKYPRNTYALVNA